jgi:hypothetical protein
MIPMSVRFQRDGEPPVWPDHVGRVIDAGLLVDVAVLDRGMESGLPSVAFRLELPDGTPVIAQQTARQIVTLARMILARYPDLMDDKTDA